MLFRSHQLTLAAMQARLYKEAANLLRRRVKAGPTGWAGEDGLYWALGLKCQCSEALKRPLDACLPDLFEYANTGLKLCRLEGVLLMNAVLTRHQCQTLTVHALASLAKFPGTWQGASWMGDPCAFTCRLRENLGVALFHMDPANEGLAAAQLYCASRFGTARLNARLQGNYKCLARDGDAMPCVKWFPEPSDFLLPAVSAYPGFLPPDRVPAFLQTVLSSGARRCWSWLRILFSNAVHSPFGMQWGADIAAGAHRFEEDACCTLVTADSHPWVFDGATPVACATGYAFILPLGFCGTARIGEDVFAMVPGRLVCVRAGVPWALVPPPGDADPGAVLVSQLCFPYFS